MGAPGTQKVAVAILLLGLAGAIGLSVAQRTGLSEAERRIERLEQRLDELRDRASTGAGEANEEPAGIEQELEKLGKRIDALLLRTTSNTRRLELIESGDIEELGIERFIEQRIGSLRGGKGLLDKRYPDLDKVAEYLDLTDRQRARIAEILDRSKDEAFRVVEAAHPDGRTLSGGLAEIMAAPMAPGQKRQGVQDLLFNHGPPGSEDSYLTHMMQIRVEALDSFQGTLTEEQNTRWRSMGFDLFGIQTGHEPFKEAAGSLLEQDP